MGVLVQRSLFADEHEADGRAALSMPDLWRRAAAMAAASDLDGAVGLFAATSTADLAAFADEWSLYPCNSGASRPVSLQRIRNALHQRTPEAVAKRAAVDRWHALQRRANVILRCAGHAAKGGHWPWADAGMLDRVHVPHSGLMPPTLEEASRGWGVDRAVAELESIVDELGRDFERNAATHYLVAKIREAIATGFGGSGPIATEERFVMGLHYDDSTAQNRSVQALADVMWRKHDA